MSSKWFSKFASYLSTMTGRPATFVMAVALVLVWAITGPFFHYSDTWQLVINTSTTIVTFLMVFLIQNTQNRDTAAMQIKLDELIRAMEGAHNALLDLEELEEKDLSRFRKHYEKLAEEARTALRAGDSDSRCQTGGRAATRLANALSDCGAHLLARVNTLAGAFLDGERMTESGRVLPHAVGLSYTSALSARRSAIPARHRHGRSDHSR